MSEYRKSFKEFIVEIANMDADDYSYLSDLPDQAKKILIAEPPELDPWDLLNQAQAEQKRLEDKLAKLEGELAIAKADRDVAENSTRNAIHKHHALELELKRKTEALELIAKHAPEMGADWALMKAQTALEGK